MDQREAERLIADAVGESGGTPNVQVFAESA
jgi:hypothetical protein